MSPLRHARLSLPTGVELEVVQSGDPHGAPLLLLHGLSDSAPSMFPLMERLPRQVRAIAVTQRGHGDSSKPCAPYTVDAFAVTPWPFSTGSGCAGPSSWGTRWAASSLNGSPA